MSEVHGERGELGCAEGFGSGAGEGGGEEGEEEGEKGVVLVVLVSRKGLCEKRCQGLEEFGGLRV